MRLTIRSEYEHQQPFSLPDCYERAQATSSDVRGRAGQRLGELVEGLDVARSVHEDYPSPALARLVGSPGTAELTAS
jgi:hypothetical protein